MLNNSMSFVYFKSTGDFLNPEVYDKSDKENVEFIEVFNKYAFLMDISNILHNFSMTDNVVLETYSLDLSLENFISQIRSDLSEPIDSTLLPEHLITCRNELSNVYKTNDTIVNVLSIDQFKFFMKELKKENVSEYERINKNYINYKRRMKIQSLRV